MSLLPRFPQISVAVLSQGQVIARFSREIEHRLRGFDTSRHAMADAAFSRLFTVFSFLTTLFLAQPEASSEERGRLNAISRRGREEERLEWNGICCHIRDVNN